MKKKIIMLSIVGTLLIIAICTGISYSLWLTSDNQTGDNYVEAGCFDITLEENTAGLSFINDYPKSDKEGMERDPYTFTLENICQIQAGFQIKIEVLPENTLDHDLIKVAIDNRPVLLNSLENINNNDYVIEKSFLDIGESRTFNFRQWIDESGTLETAGNSVVKTRIVVESIPAKIPPYGADVLADLLNDSDNSLVDDDPNGDIRYIGANPNNYVSFNNEIWRIVGLFSNIQRTKNGEEELRIKLVGPNQEEVAYDTNSNNNWATATSQIMLNTTYYDSLTTDAKLLIDDTVWHLGGFQTPEHTLTEFYAQERGTNVVPGHASSWVGKIALLYTSDYGYATSGGTTEDREACLSYKMNEWENKTDCYHNNYLYPYDNMWFLNPNSNLAGYSFNVTYFGQVSNYYSNDEEIIKPTVYLRPNIRFVSGDGTLENPYQLSA